MPQYSALVDAAIAAAKAGATEQEKVTTIWSSVLIFYHFRLR